MTPPDNLLANLNRPRGDTRDSVAGLLELLDEVDTPSAMAMDTDTPTTQLNLDPKDIFGPTSEEKIADLVMSRSNQTPTNVSAPSPASQHFLSEVDVADLFRGKGW